MPLNQILRDGESQSRSPCASAHQGKEKFFTQLRGHARPVVGHVDANHEGVAAALDGVLTLDAGAKKEHPPVLHRLTGVAHEIEKDLHDLFRIGLEHGKARVVITIETKTLWALAACETGHAFDRFVDVDRSPLRGTSWAQEAFDEPRKAIDFLNDDLRAGVPLGIVGVTPRKKLGSPTNPGKRIADLVGQGADKMARGLMPRVECIFSADEKMAVERRQFHQEQVLGVGSHHTVDGQLTSGDFNVVLAVGAHLPTLQQATKILGQGKKSARHLVPPASGQAEKFLRCGIGVVHSKIRIDAEYGDGETLEKRRRFRRRFASNPQHAILILRTDGRLRVQRRTFIRVPATGARGCGCNNTEC